MGQNKEPTDRQKLKISEERMNYLINSNETIQKAQIPTSDTDIKNSIP